MSLRARLAEGRCLVGTIIASDSAVASEIVGLSGLDWVFFDLEHSANSLETVQRQMQALGERVLSVIRVESANPVAIRRALDAGCGAVIVPQVDSAEIARGVVEAGKYPPLGRRSVGAGRAHGYGGRFTEYLATANRETAVIVQIESIAAVEAIESIVAVEGLDGVFIGPWDLSASMGLTGEVRHPVVLDAIARARIAARRAGLPVGFSVGTDAAAREVAGDYQLLLVGSDVGRLRQSLAETVASVRG
jgi:2-keto-3-deoxy-L-rhamnonate aldolase RhmA